MTSDVGFLDSLLEMNRFAKQPVVVCDVGARLGFDPIWEKYRDQIKLFGFEPDKEECDRLNSLRKTGRETFFPFFLGKAAEKRTAYITQLRASSGMFEADMKFWGRFPDQVHLRVLKTESVETIDLDAFCKTTNAGDFKDVDFMKLDVEGAEMDVLRGAEGTLKNTLLGLSIEVGFPRHREGMSIFSELDLYLRDLGFELYDLNLFRHARSAFPERLNPGQMIGPILRGQVIWGQALYLRDAEAEILRHTKAMVACGWDDTRILKLCTFYEVFNLHDCAIELLQFARSRNKLRDLDIESCLDLLVQDAKPDLGPVTYQEYMKSLSGDADIVRREKKPPHGRRVAYLKKVLHLAPRPLRRAGKALLDSLR